MGGEMDIPSLVNAVLDDALRARASDVHVEPTREGCEIRCRVDGLLQVKQTLPRDVGRGVVNRLMVMAQLLTYRLDVPQEGRINVSLPSHPDPLDLRLAIIPTTHGLRAAVRLPADLLAPRTLDELQLPKMVIAGLRDFASADSGLLILTGPAGTGKTTTIYALLGAIAAGSPGLSIICLEDPVERHIPGVTQIEVSPFGQLTYDKCLRSILRQDPQVLMLGEIRDAATAGLAIQAALSGHRLISTLHASEPAGAVARLMEMGLETYQITSAIWGIVAQRLLRRRQGAGYQGRLPVAELVRMDEPLRQAVLRSADAQALRQAYAQQPAYRPMRQVAAELIDAGLTDRAEVDRVLGPTNSATP